MVQCPACQTPVNFQSIAYGQPGRDQYQGFQCPQCGGLGLRIRSIRRTPTEDVVTYPWFTPFGALERCQFIAAEERRDTFTFVNRHDTGMLDPVIVRQLDGSAADDTPELIGEFH